MADAPQSADGTGDVTQHENNPLDLTIWVKDRRGIGYQQA